MKTIAHASWCWALPATASAQQPPIQNGKVETRKVAALDKEIATIAAGATTDPVWVGWRVPIVDGERGGCSTWVDRRLLLPRPNPGLRPDRRDGVHGPAAADDAADRRDRARGRHRPRRCSFVSSTAGSSGMRTHRRRLPHRRRRPDGLLARRRHAGREPATSRRVHARGRIRAAVDERAPQPDAIGTLGHCAAPRCRRGRDPRPVRDGHHRYRRCASTRSRSSAATAARTASRCCRSCSRASGRPRLAWSSSTRSARHESPARSERCAGS